MKRISNISINLSVSDVGQAARRAFEGHSGNGEVVKFREDFEHHCTRLYDSLKDGSWQGLLNYRSMEKVNNNGKRRHIDCPSLVTRIYQHLMLNLLEPVYGRKDNLNGLNCKKGCGIAATDKRRSVLRRLKHAFYDRRDLHWFLIIDQRKCYEHVTEKAARRALKRLVSDPWLVDFAVKVSFVGGKLPIGTPASPFIHHVVMLGFDHWVKSIAPMSVRYADDNFLAFATKEEAQSAKWRVKNYWWYELGIRAKRHTVTVRSMDEPMDFCGNVVHRNPCTGHNKGYVRIRRSIADRARRCRDNRSWASYFGLMKHADCYALMRKIEKDMKLKELTRKIRIDRRMDARHIDMKELVGVPFTIHDYEIRYDSKKEPNWIKCLIGVEETCGGQPTGRTLAYEFHGNYQGIIQFILACEKEYGRQALLPLEEMEIENQCGYIFKGSTNQLIYMKIMKPVINYIEVPSKLEEDINRGKTTWRNGKCVMLDEGRHATVYIGHKEETRYDLPPEGEASERQATMAFPVRVKKPLTKAKAVNAAEMQAYALADALEVASLAASLARKHRENINDLDVKEHDEFIAWVKRELDASGLFTQSETRVDAESPTLGDLVAIGRLAARGDTDMTDTQRVKVSRLFPTWDELVAKGEQLPAGTGLQYGGDFYKVVQAHTPQSDWKPSEQHALYAYVSDHEGTQDDPIPYRHWMLLEQGKYYTENGKTYRCTQSPGAGYGSDLEELSQFVEPII